MTTITLTKVENLNRDPWLVALAMDFTLPKGHASVFVGRGLNDERMAFWIHPDGSGFGAVDSDPEGFVESSAAMWKGDLNFESNHPGVDELWFEPGQFDPLAETLEIEARSSLY